MSCRRAPGHQYSSGFGSWGSLQPYLGHQHEVRGLRLGEALADVLVLGYLAVLKEVLVAAGHLEQVLGLELVHHAHLVVLRLKLIRVPD